MNFPERHHKTVNRTAVFHALMLSMCLSGIIYMYSWFFLHLYFGPKPTEKLFSRLFFGALYSSLGAGIIVFIKIYRHLKDVSGEDLKQPLNQISLEILQQQ